MNQVCLTGRLTKDIELKHLQDNKNCLFTIAVDKGMKDEAGNRLCDFISCVAWNNQAEFLSKYCHKGDMIGVVGRIQTRNYQAQDGSTRFITEVICNQVEAYGLKKQEENQQQQQPKNTGMKVNGKNYQPVNDDSLPF